MIKTKILEVITIDGKEIQRGESFHVEKYIVDGKKMALDKLETQELANQGKKVVKVIEKQDGVYTAKIGGWNEKI